MMASPESQSRSDARKPKELDTDKNSTSMNDGSRPPASKSKPTPTTMNPFRELSDSANFPPFHQAIVDDDDDGPCNNSDFRLSDLSIGALAALTEHQRHIAKHGLDNSLCGARDQCHETSSQSSTPKQNRNPLDAEWSRILDSSSLVNSAINQCETSALQCVDEGMNVYEVASHIPSLNEGSDYFESSRVWALETPERARQKRNFISSRGHEDESYDAESVIGSPNSHGLPARSPQMSPPSFGVSPMSPNDKEGTPTDFGTTDRDSSIVSLSAINISHISGVDLVEGSEIVFDTGESDNDFASDTKMRLFQDDDRNPPRSSPKKIEKESTIVPACAAPASSSKTLATPTYAHRYNATRSMYAAKIAKAYVPFRSSEKMASTEATLDSSAQSNVSSSRAPLAVLENKPSLSANLEESASVKDGKENSVISHIPYSSTPKKLDTLQNTTALSTPPVPTPHSEANLPHTVSKPVNPTEQLLATPSKSERLRYRSVVPIRVFLEDREKPNEGWYNVQHDSLSVPLAKENLESYSRMFELAAQKDQGRR